MPRLNTRYILAPSRLDKTTHGTPRLSTKRRRDYVHSTGLKTGMLRVWKEVWGGGGHACRISSMSQPVQACSSSSNNSNNNSNNSSSNSRSNNNSGSYHVPGMGVVTSWTLSHDLLLLSTILHVLHTIQYSYLVVWRKRRLEVGLSGWSHQSYSVCTLYAGDQATRSPGDKPDWPITWPVLLPLDDISARFEWLNDFSWC